MAKTIRRTSRGNPDLIPLMSHPEFHAIAQHILTSDMTLQEIARQFRVAPPMLCNLSAAIGRLRDNGFISGTDSRSNNHQPNEYPTEQRSAPEQHPAPNQPVVNDQPVTPLTGQSVNSATNGKDRATEGERFSARKRIAAGSLRKNEGRVRELELMYQRKWQIVRRRVRMYRQYRDIEPGADSGFLQRVERGSSGVTWVQWEYDKDLARDLRAILEAIAKELHQDQPLVAPNALPATKIYSAPGSTVHIHTDAAVAPAPAPMPALEAAPAVIDIRRHEAVSVSGASVAG